MKQLKFLSVFCLLALLLFGLSGCFLTNKDPEPQITARPLSGNAPLEVFFDATGSEDPDGEIEEYSWNFDDGSQGAGEKITHTFQGKGSYNVELTVTDDGGSEVSTNIDITVTNTSPKLRVHSTPSSLEGNVPFEVKLDLSDSDDPDGTIENYEVDFDDGETAEGTDILEKITHTYDEPGTYELTVSITDNSGATSSVSNTVTVKEKEKTNQKPTAKINLDPSEGKAPLKVTADGTGSADSDGKIERYVWEFGGEETKTGAKVEHAFDSSGQYEITLTVVDDEGSQATVSQTTSVSSPIYEVGETADNGYFKMTLKEVTKRESIAGREPASRNQFVVVDLELESLREEQYLSKTLDFTCQDSRGEVHNVSLATSFLNNYLTNDALGENQSRTGKLAFEVPRLASSYTLIFAPPGQPELKFRFTLD